MLTWYEIYLDSMKDQNGKWTIYIYKKNVYMYSVERLTVGYYRSEAFATKESHSQKRSKQQKTLFILKGKLTKEHTQKNT